jgi:hypothetical protein
MYYSLTFTPILVANYVLFSFYYHVSLGYQIGQPKCIFPFTFVQMLHFTWLTLDTWTHGKIKLQSSIHILYSCQILKQNCIDNFVIHTQAHKQIMQAWWWNLFAFNKVNATHMSPYLWTFNEVVNGATTNFPPILHYDYINKWTTFKLTTIFMYFMKIKQSKCTTTITKFQETLIMKDSWHTRHSWKCTML